MSSTTSICIDEVVLSHFFRADEDSNEAGLTLEDKLAKSDPEFLQFLKDEGSSDMLGWAAEDLSASSSDEVDNDDGDDDAADGGAAHQASKMVIYLWHITDRNCAGNQF